MKQLKNYFQKVDDLKTQLKNLSYKQQQMDQKQHKSFIPSKQKPNKDKSKDQKIKKQNSFYYERKIDNSLNKNDSKNNKSITRYSSKNSNDSKNKLPKSNSHYSSAEYEKIKMTYLKNAVKKSQQRKPKKQEIQKLINSIKSRQQIIVNKQNNKQLVKANTISVDKKSNKTVPSNQYQSLQVDIQSFPFKLSYSYRTRQGVLATNPKKVNQDSLLIKTKITNKNIHLFAVADGHGVFGHQISQLVARNLSKLMESYLKNSSVQESFRLAYNKLQQLITQSQINASCSGTTLVSVLIKPNQLICANVGDSRAILAKKLQKKTWEIIQLSKDHKPCLQQQKNRIIKCGGRIQSFKDQNGLPLGPQRVWLPNQNLQGLAMSRSLGDNISKPIGVTCEPDIFKLKIEQNDKFILIASDGVWEFISNEEIVQLVAPYYKQNKLQEACDSLMKLAYEKWTVQDETVIDDITLILIFLNN